MGMFEKALGNHSILYLHKKLYIYEDVYVYTYIYYIHSYNYIFVCLIYIIYTHINISINTYI